MKVYYRTVFDGAIWGTYPEYDSGRVSYNVLEKPPIEFCCEEMELIWNNNADLCAKFIDDSERDSHSILIHGVGLSYFDKYRDEDREICFISWCPFCGEKIETIEHEKLRIVKDGEKTIPPSLSLPKVEIIAHVEKVKEYFK